MLSLQTRLKQYLCEAYRLQKVADSGQCPRASCSAIVLSGGFEILGVGRNLIPEDQQHPCDCDCGTPTEVAKGRGCRAIHAEAAALESLSEFDHPMVMITTRPPCKDCIELLIDSPIVIIATTDQYPDRDGSRERWAEVYGDWEVFPYLECLGN